MRAGDPAACAGVEARSPAGHRQRAHEVGIEHQPGVVLGRHQGAQPTDEQEVLLHGGLALLGSHPLRGLEHRLPGRVAAVVVHEGGAEGGDGLDLGDPVEGATLVELHVDVPEGLEACPDPRGGAAYALGHRADPTVLPREDGDDPVGLAQLLGTQDDTLVAVETHHPIVTRRADGGPPWLASRGPRSR